MAVDVAVGIVVGVLVGAVVQVLASLWLAAHGGRMAARALLGELAQHRLALDRWLDEEDCLSLPSTDQRFRRTFAEQSVMLGKPVPVLPYSAWVEAEFA